MLALATGLSIAGLTGVATAQDLSRGLSNGGVITVAAMLIIAKGVVQTGVVTRATWKLLSGVDTAQQALGRLSLPVGLISSLINTTPIVAMLIPASHELEQTRGVPARKVLLPIAHVTTLFGSITLIGTSSNLIIAGIADDYHTNMTMLSFAPVALPVAIVGTLVIYFLAPRMLGGSTAPAPEPTMTWRVELSAAPHALMVGNMAADLGLAATKEFVLVEIHRGNDVISPESAVAAEDILVFVATEDGIGSLWKNPLFGLAPQRLYAISLGSDVNGTLRDFERNKTIRVVAARTHDRLNQSPMIPGETLFVTGESRDDLQENRAVALWRDAASRSPQPGKTWVALGILLAVIVAASFGLAPVEITAVGGACLMVLTNTLTPSSAARALDWNVLGVLAGSVGLGSIVVTSGLAQELSDAIERVSNGSVLGVVIALVLTTTVLTNVITNSAAAAILTPIAIGLSKQVGIDPVIALATIGTCISFTLINPFSHQSNMMVMKPGGYTNLVFARFGTPLLAVVVLTAMTTSYLLIRV
ncbi:MAG: SLC13 family permease [Thermomicrobiales bacterium]